MTTVSKPNLALRQAREKMRLSLDEFAVRLRLAGERAGEPNDVSKRHVQRWEAGVVVMPRPYYVRALEAVTGLPITSLGFPAGSDAMVVDDGRGGHDFEVRAVERPAPSAERRPHGQHGGVWLSSYQFFSSGRGEALTNAHHVVVLQHDDRLTVRSLNGPEKSLLTMDLSVEANNVITGTWAEETERDGYYRGARYFGAIQMLAEPTGRRMEGKWVGFGKQMELNTGPWTLEFLDESTTKGTLAKYSAPPPGSIGA